MRQISWWARVCRVAACHACYFSHTMLPGGCIRSGTCFQRLRTAHGCIMSARPLLSPARSPTCGTPRVCQSATLPRRGRKWAAPVVAAARFGGARGSQAAGLQAKARSRLAARETPCQRRPLELASVQAGAPAVANRKREKAPKRDHPFATHCWLTISANEFGRDNSVGGLGRAGRLRCRDNW